MHGLSGNTPAGLFFLGTFGIVERLLLVKMFILVIFKPVILAERYGIYAPTTGA
jgi:hypothetical protein